MNGMIYAGTFGGVPLRFSFRHPDTARYFGSWVRPASGPAGALIAVPPEDGTEWMQDYQMPDDGNTEFGLSLYRASDALLSEGRCVFHAAALLWRGKALLFSADSGTGKSTQLSHWMGLYGDEVRIMNGDKPVLELADDGSVIVHPSPWKGKEEWGDDSLTAPLGGIVLLKQGRENDFRRLTASQSAATVIAQIFSRFETPAAVHRLCRFAGAVLEAAPVWKLTNKGDGASARLVHDMLLREGGFDDVQG